jgi:pyruvate/2-oxoglutarate dehydrogenase complex dihydrolipoamide dehydrogenase (E3) component
MSPVRVLVGQPPAIPAWEGNLAGTTDEFDAIIVGSGQAGPPLAAWLAGAGMRVAIVERHLMGGTCLNVGCTPTKTMIASAYAAHMTRRAADFGVRLPGPVTVDLCRAATRAGRRRAATARSR